MSPLSFCLSPSPTFSLLLPHPQVDVNQTSKVVERRSGGFGGGFGLGGGGGGGTVEKTPLHIAVEKGSTEIAALLIEAKADMTIACGGRTPLDIATQKGHTEIADLIEALFPLYAAAAKGDIALVTRLIEEGQVDINETNDKGVTPLHITAEKGSTEIAVLLIEAKVRSMCWRGA